MKTGKRRMLEFALAVLALLVVFVLAVRLFENRMIYFPAPLAGGELARLVSPAEGETFEEVEMVTGDGVRITGWWGSPAEPVATLLWLHGNAGNVWHRQDDFLRFVRECRFAVLLLDYRGYGRSEGSPDEAGLYLDARAALDWLAKRGTSPEEVTVLGRSLGGAVAIELASARPVGRLILESTFTSARDMARKMFPLLPVHLVIRSRFDSESRMADLTLPILQFHGRHDTIVPFAQGERLAAAATRADHRFVAVDCDHNDLSVTLGREYFRRIVEFVTPPRK